MTIKQLGGVFGRNPDFNDVTANEVEANTVLANGVYGKADPNTGWTWSGSDILLGIAGGSERVRLTSSTALDVAGTSFFRGNMGLFSATGGAVPSSQLTFGSAALINGGRIFSQTESGTAASLYLATAQTGTGTMTNRLRLTADGDVNVLNGNLVIGTSGAGIDFSATAGTGTSELFDDYEEGTWTPTVIGPDGGSAGSLAYTSSGTYTKVGRLVTVYATINITVASSYTGRFFVSGVPFSSASGASYVGGNVWFQNVSVTNGFICAPQIGAASANYIQFPYSTNAGGSGGLNWATNVTTGLILLSHTYPV